MTIYTDFLNEYKMIDFSLSHSQLLIRSMKNRGRDHNINVLFKGVEVMIIPVDFRGIEIVFSPSPTAESLSLKKYGFETNKNSIVFDIRDLEGNTYHIKAMAFGVFHNTLEILETSIGRYDWHREGEMLFWFNGR